MTGVIRILLLGDMAVGKSRLLERLVSGGWTDGCTPGLTFLRKTMEVGGRTYNLQVYDTPAAPRMWAVNCDSPYLTNIACVMLVYDLTNRESFEHITTWLYEADTYCVPEGSRIIVGNKADICNKREVDCGDAMRIANELGFPYIETSAWTQENVMECFKLAVATELERRATIPKDGDA